MLSLAYKCIIRWFDVLPVTERVKHLALIKRGLRTADCYKTRLCLGYLREQVGTVAEPDVVFATADLPSRHFVFADPDELVSLYQLTHQRLGVTRRSPSAHRQFVKSATEVALLTGDTSWTLEQLLADNILHSSLSWREVPTNDVVKRAINVLDRTPHMDLHKIGVLYVGYGQLTEHEILGNQGGSARYQEFLSHLGEYVLLSECRDKRQFSGGLNYEDDGLVSLYHADQHQQLMFHVATMMPTGHVNKKRHVANDFVRVVWNDNSQNEYQPCTSGQFDFVDIVVTPTTAASYRVSMMRRQDVQEFGPLVHAKIFDSLSTSADFVRHAATMADHFA